MSRAGVERHAERRRVRRRPVPLRRPRRGYVVVGTRSYTARLACRAEGNWNCTDPRLQLAGLAVEPGRYMELKLAMTPGPTAFPTCE